MTRRFYLWAALGLTMGLTACGRSTPPAPPPSPAAAPAPAPNRDDDEERRRREAEAEAARRRAAEEAQRIRTVLAERIHFDYDRSDIRPDARPVLDRKVEILHANVAIRLRIEGHADERGSDEYNLALAMRRAAAAKQYFVGRGLDASRFEVLSFGEERPLERGKNESAWAKNRRDEFIVTAGAVADR